MIKFQTGKTYSARSICDHNCIFSFTVLKRTAKRLTLKYGKEVFQKGISLWNDEESCFPLGKFSMAPIIRASEVAA